jgi:hypothetical protein
MQPLNPDTVRGWICVILAQMYRYVKFEVELTWRLH